MPRCDCASSQRISHLEIGISDLEIEISALVIELSALEIGLGLRVGLGLGLEQLAHVLELGLAPHRRLHQDLVKVRVRVRG